MSSTSIIGFKESLKAALKNAIENQDQENNEEFYQGYEEALNYALEMIDKHVPSVNPQKESVVLSAEDALDAHFMKRFGVSFHSAILEPEDYGWGIINEEVVKFSESFADLRVQQEREKLEKEIQRRIDLFPDNDDLPLSQRGALDAYINCLNIFKTLNHGK